MKIAHIILAHSKPLQLKRLIESLHFEHTRIFVHLDLKCDLHDFDFLNHDPYVILIARRKDVKWGGYSLVEAIVNSFTQIVNSDIPFDYVNLISAQDYPLKPMAEFHAYLKQRPNRDFMEFHLPDHDWVKETKHRIRRYHLTDYKFKGSTLIETLINYILPYKKLPSHFEIIGHSAWFTLDHDSVNYLVSFFRNEKAFIKKFKLTWGADEFLIPSLLYNSPLKSKIVNDNLRYIDWSEGKANPKILTTKDKESLLSTPCFFGRKFDMDIDASILDELDRKIK